jgi:hypothetical protein
MGKRFKGEQLTKLDVIDEEIKVLDFDLRKSYYRERGYYALIQAELNDKLVYFSIGDKAIVRSLRRMNGSDIPFITKIVENEGEKGKYLMFEYTLPIPITDIGSTPKADGAGGTNYVTNTS